VGAGGRAVSDSFDWIQGVAGEAGMDGPSAEEFLVSGFVYGPATLHPKVQAVQAGELVRIAGGGEIERRRHFSFNCDRHQDPELRLDRPTFEKIDRLLLRAFERMVASVPDIGRWVVPLSGGYDSRLVVSYLHRLGLKNVVCFSYGRAGNAESEISRQIAAAFGYEWHFVEYDRDGWSRLLSDPAMQDAIRRAHNGSSLPILHYFRCVRELGERGLVGPGDVFVPGHTFDFIRGKQLWAEAVELGAGSISAAGRLIRRRHASYWPDESAQDEIQQRIEKLIEQESESVRGASAAAIMEWFNWQERQAKYIVNSVRIYENFGYRWRLPLWDGDIVHWWMTVPYEHRLNDHLFCAAYEAVLGPAELREIPIFGKAGKETGRESRRRARGWRTRLAGTIAGGWLGTRVRRVCRGVFPPRERKSPWAFEEYFVDQAVTIGELLGLEGPRPVAWPARLRRHFRWREQWPVGLPGAMPHALLGAYLLKQFWLRPAEPK
jgi:asparagine synthase (glutamine-hydrolysing)